MSKHEKKPVRVLIYGVNSQKGVSIQEKGARSQLISTGNHNQADPAVYTTTTKSHTQEIIM